MKLRERYRKLTFWNKIGFWGALAGIASLIIVIFTLLVPKKPASNITYVNIFNEVKEKQQRADSDVLVTRNFQISREEGSVIILGPCPGNECLEIKLGKLEKMEGAEKIFTVELKF